MYTLAYFLSRAPSGLYRLVGDRPPRNMRTLCRLSGVELLHVSAAQAHDKRRFLGAAARAMHLPAWFGMNWDAFADCLTDFAWKPGSTHVLLLSDVDGFAKRSPADFANALAVLADAASFWAQRGVRFLILIQSRKLPKTLRLSTVCAR